jgi:hypothetical protein
MYPKLPQYETSRPHAAAGVALPLSVGLHAMDAADGRTDFHDRPERVKIAASRPASTSSA